MFHIKYFYRIITALFITLFSFTPSFAETIILKVSHYLPPSHGFHTDLIVPWARDIEEKTNGKVKVIVYDATTPFGKITLQADQVRAGIVDIALGLNGIPNGRFPASSIIEMPFMVDRSEAGSRALWELYQTEQLGNEYDDFKVLSLFTHNGGLIHSRTKLISDYSDLDGMLMRTPGASASVFLRHFGASPIGMPPKSIAPNLKSGKIDGLTTTWDLVYVTKSIPLLKYHTDARIYAAGFHFVMNKDKYNSLPEDIRTIIDETTGTKIIEKMSVLWDKWDSKGAEQAKSIGNQVIRLDDNQRKTWLNALQGTIDGYLSDLEKQGVQNPQGLYKKAQELVLKYN